jgi:hypothetical protein
VCRLDFWDFRGSNIRNSPESPQKIVAISVELKPNVALTI